MYQEILPFHLTVNIFILFLTEILILSIPILNGIIPTQT